VICYVPALWLDIWPLVDTGFIVIISSSSLVLALPEGPRPIAWASASRLPAARRPQASLGPDTSAISSSDKDGGRRGHRARVPIASDCQKGAEGS